MVEKIRKNKILLLFLLTIAVWFFLKYITPLVTPILLAMLFVTIFGTTMKKMQKKFHIHRQISAVILLLTAGFFVILLTWIFFSWIVGSLPEWINSLDVIEKELTVMIHDICNMVGRTIGIDNVYLENRILAQVQSGFDYFQLQSVPGMLSQSWEYLKTILTLGGFLMTFIIAVVLLAKDYDDIMNRLLDKEECHVLLEVICGIIRYIATFVKAQFIIMSIFAAVLAICLAIAKIPHGVLWGILAGILDVLPFIGTGSVLIPLAIVQLFQGFFGKALLCIGLYIGCAVAREFLEPKLIGNRMGISPIALVLSLYAGIQLFGVWGIIKGPLGFVIIKETYESMKNKGVFNQIK